MEASQQLKAYCEKSQQYRVVINPNSINQLILLKNNLSIKDEQNQRNNLKHKLCNFVILDTQQDSPLNKKHQRIKINLYTMLNMMKTKDSHQTRVKICRELFQLIQKQQSYKQALKSKPQCKKLYEKLKIYIEDWENLSQKERDHQIIYQYTSSYFFHQVLNIFLRKYTFPEELFYVQPFSKPSNQKPIQNTKLIKKYGKEFTCFRVCFFSEEETNQFLNSVGCFMQNLGILSASKSERYQFVIQTFPNCNTIIQIRVDDKGHDIPGYYNADDISAQKEEQLQVAFNFHNLFQLIQAKSIDYGENTYMYFVLKLSSYEQMKNMKPGFHQEQKILKNKYEISLHAGNFIQGYVYIAAQIRDSWAALIYFQKLQEHIRLFDKNHRSQQKYCQGYRDVQQSKYQLMNNLITQFKRQINPRLSADTNLQGKNIFITSYQPKNFIQTPLEFSGADLVKQFLTHFNQLLSSRQFGQINRMVGRFIRSYQKAVESRTFCSPEEKAWQYQILSILPFFEYMIGKISLSQSFFKVVKVIQQTWFCDFYQSDTLLNVAKIKFNDKVKKRSQKNKNSLQMEFLRQLTGSEPYSLIFQQAVNKTVTQAVCYLDTQENQFQDGISLVDLSVMNQYRRRGVKIYLSLQDKIINNCQNHALIQETKKIYQRFEINLNQSAVYRAQKFRNFYYFVLYKEFVQQLLTQWIPRKSQEQIDGSQPRKRYKQ